MKILNKYIIVKIFYLKVCESVTYDTKYRISVLKVDDFANKIDLEYIAIWSGKSLEKVGNFVEAVWWERCFNIFNSRLESVFYGSP